MEEDIIKDLIVIKINTPREVITSEGKIVKHAGELPEGWKEKI